MTLKLDVETVAERRLHRLQRLNAFSALSLSEQRIDRPVGSARQQDKPLRARHHLVPRHTGLGHFARVQIGGRRQGAQVQPSGRILRQQNHGRRLGPARIDLAADADDRQGAGHDGLDTRILGRLAELQRTEQVGPVRHGHGGHSGVRRQLADFAGLYRTFQQGIGRTNPQMDETLTVHRLAHWISVPKARGSRPSSPLLRVSHPAPGGHRKPDGARRHPQNPSRNGDRRHDKTESNSSRFPPNALNCRCAKSDGLDRRLNLRRPSR